MAKLLTLILLLTLTGSSLLVVLILLIWLRDSGGTPEHPRNCDFSGLAYVFSLGLLLFSTLLATSCYLNLRRSVRQNKLYSALSFFLLPGLLCLITAGSLLDEGIPLLCIVFLPFFTLLTIGFRRFRKSLRRTDG